MLFDVGHTKYFIGRCIESLLPDAYVPVHCTGDVPWGKGNPWSTSRVMRGKLWVIRGPFQVMRGQNTMNNQFYTEK